MVIALNAHFALRTVHCSFGSPDVTPFTVVDQRARLLGILRLEILLSSNFHLFAFLQTEESLG